MNLATVTGSFGFYASTECMIISVRVVYTELVCVCMKVLSVDS